MRAHRLECALDSILTGFGSLAQHALRLTDFASFASYSGMLSFGKLAGQMPASTKPHLFVFGGHSGKADRVTWSSCLESS